MPYLAIRNRQLHIYAFEKANVDSVYKHLKKKRNSHYDLTRNSLKVFKQKIPKGLSFVADMCTASMHKLEQSVRGENWVILKSLKNIFWKYTNFLPCSQLQYYTYYTIKFVSLAAETGPKINLLAVQQKPDLAISQLAS